MLQSLDKIITLSVTIIGVSITIFIALGNNPIIKDVCVGNFLILWICFATATIFGISAYIAYSQLKHVQSALYGFQSEKNEAESMLIYPPLIKAEGKDLTDSDIEQIKKNITVWDKKIKIQAKKEDFYISMSNSGYISWIAFLIGLGWFVVIGFNLIY